MSPCGLLLYVEAKSSSLTREFDKIEKQKAVFKVGGIEDASINHR